MPARSPGPSTVESGANPHRDLVGLPPGDGDCALSKDLEGRHPERRRLRLVLRPGHIGQCPRTPRPPGCGRSTCTRRPARTSGSRAIAAQIQLPTLVKSGTVDQTAYKALPPVPAGFKGYPTNAQVTAAEDLVAKDWSIKVTS